MNARDLKTLQSLAMRSENLPALPNAYADAALAQREAVQREAGYYGATLSLDGAPKLHRPEGLEMTLTTDQVSHSGNITHQMLGNMEKGYKEIAVADNTYNKVFGRSIWEVPGWSTPVSCLEAMFGRGLNIHYLAKAKGVTSKELCNEEKVATTVCNIAREYEFPFICVGRKILEAASQTKPFDSWDFRAMPLPFPCITFLLPKGTRIAGERFTHITIAVYTSAHTDKCKVITVGGYQSLMPFMSVHELDEDRVFNVREKVMSDGNNFATADDREWAISLSQVALNLVGIMHVRHDLETDVSHLRTVGKGERTKEVRKARTLGVGYHYKSQSASENGGRGKKGGKTAAHWRRGHWHTVLYGKGRAQQKMMWYEPIFVNAGK